MLTVVWCIGGNASVQATLLRCSIMTRQTSLLKQSGLEPVD